LCYVEGGGEGGATPCFFFGVAMSHFD